MKSLAERKEGRKKDREEVLKNKDFDHAEFLRNSKGGANRPGEDTSKGSNEGSEGDGTKSKASDKEGGSDDKKEGGEGSSEAGAGGNANKPAKPTGDAEKARQKAAQSQGGTGWGAQGVGGNAGTPGGRQSPNPQS